MEQLERILVIGGGVGGLAAGALLAQRGFDVQLAERKPAFDVQGVGLGQPANALRALRAVGVLEDVNAAGFQFEHFRIYDHNRELIVDHRFLLGDDEVPAVTALPRRDLHRILLAAAEGAGCQVRLGREPARLAERGDAVEVAFEDGTAETFDLVVGFDGFRSWTRRQLFGNAYEPVYSGYAAWRLIVERPPEVDAMEFYQGPGSKTGVMPLTPERMYLFHIRPESGEWQDPARFHELLRQRLSGYGGVAAKVRERLSADDEIFYSPLEPLFVDAPWYRGRVAIAGDAAHTYPPHMTQGAAMALEDAVVLAEELAGDAPVEQRLAAYLGRRMDRCSFVYGFANRMLRDEQRIQTVEELARARDLFIDLDERLDQADRVMNEDVLRTSAPPTPARRRS